MKFCLRWNNISRCLQEADEISIEYIEDKGLVDFMEKYAGKRIIIRMTSDIFNDTEIAKLAAIHRQLPQYDFTIGLKSYNKQIIKKLQEKDLSFYITTPVVDWETLYHYVMELKVSDIDITGPLGFDLIKVRKIINRAGGVTKVRATPNIAASSTSYCNDLIKFFIRPEDLELYETYIDVIEFTETNALEHQDTFFNIYAKEHMFIGKLNQMIYNVPNLNIDNLGLIQYFGERRISCGRECLYAGRCKRCYTLSSIAEKMGTEVRGKVKENLKEQQKELDSAYEKAIHKN